MKKCIVISDSFKGTLSSQEICEIARQSIPRIFPDCQIVAIPVADGGEGTIDAVVSAVGGTKRKVNVRGPMGDVVEASYAILPDGSAFIEMAQASGITLVPKSERNPGLATTYGTGQLIHHAINSGSTISSSPLAARQPTMAVWVACKHWAHGSTTKTENCSTAAATTCCASQQSML